MARRILLSLVLLVVVLAIGGFALAWHPAIAPVPAPQRPVSPPSRWRAAPNWRRSAIARSATPRRAGGPMPAAARCRRRSASIYATNITPDPATGIGSWSEAAFRRAMRDGVDRGGPTSLPGVALSAFHPGDRRRHRRALRLPDDARAGARARRRPNRLPFPLNLRPLLAGWNLLFLHPGPWQPDPAHDADWNRGAYLVEALGHCGACHTPHNALGAEQSRPALRRRRGRGLVRARRCKPRSPAPAAWTVDELPPICATAFDAQHGAAGRADGGGHRGARPRAGGGCARHRGLPRRR